MVGLVQSNHTFPYLNRASDQHYNFLFLVRNFFFLKYDYSTTLSKSHIIIPVPVIAFTH